MTTNQTITLFKKLFNKGSRSRTQWVDMIKQLVSDGEMTKSEALNLTKWGVQPAYIFDKVSE